MHVCDVLFYLEAIALIEYVSGIRQLGCISFHESTLLYDSLPIVESFFLPSEPDIQHSAYHQQNVPDCSAYCKRIEITLHE